MENFSVHIGAEHAQAARKAAQHLRQTDIERDALGQEPEFQTKEHAGDVKVGGVAVERLRSLIERVERLEEERKAIGSDIKDIFAESKSAGFDVAVMKQLIRLRKKEPAELEEQDLLLDTYKRALGME